jgi:excisionase family DNA binding protein
VSNIVHTPPPWRVRRRRAHLRPAEAADALGVSTRTLARWAKLGYIQVIPTPGGHNRYPYDEVLRIAREQQLSWAFEATS